jgi:hypothetical protein
LRFGADATQLWALDSSGALTAYAVPSGAVLLHLPGLHQPGACTCFTLLPPCAGSKQQVLVTGGSDQTIKRVICVPSAAGAGGGDVGAHSSTGGDAGAAAAQGQSLLAVVQVEAYVGSPGTLTDVAFCAGHIVSVTHEDAILVWQQLQPVPAAPAAARMVGLDDSSLLHQPRQPGAPAAVAAQRLAGPLQADATISQRSWLVPVQDGAGMDAQQQQQQQQQEGMMTGQGTWSTASWQTPQQAEAGECPYSCLGRAQERLCSTPACSLAHRTRLQAQHLLHTASACMDSCTPCVPGPHQVHHRSLTCSPCAAC